MFKDKKKLKEFKDIEKEIDKFIEKELAQSSDKENKKENELIASEDFSKKDEYNNKEDEKKEILDLKSEEIDQRFERIEWPPKKDKENVIEELKKEKTLPKYKEEIPEKVIDEKKLKNGLKEKTEKENIFLPIKESKEKIEPPTHTQSKELKEILKEDEQKIEHKSIDEETKKDFIPIKIDDSNKDISKPANKINLEKKEIDDEVIIEEPEEQEEKFKEIKDSGKKSEIYKKEDTFDFKIVIDNVLKKESPVITDYKELKKKSIEKTETPKTEPIDIKPITDKELVIFKEVKKQKNIEPETQKQKEPSTLKQLDLKTEISDEYKEIKEKTDKSDKKEVFEDEKIEDKIFIDVFSDMPQVQDQLFKELSIDNKELKTGKKGKLQEFFKRIIESLHTHKDKEKTRKKQKLRLKKEKENLESQKLEISKEVIKDKKSEKNKKLFKKLKKTSDKKEIIKEKEKTKDNDLIITITPEEKVELESELEPEKTREQDVKFEEIEGITDKEITIEESIIGKVPINIESEKEIKQIKKKRFFKTPIKKDKIKKIKEQEKRLEREKQIVKTQDKEIKPTPIEGIEKIESIKEPEKEKRLFRKKTDKKISEKGPLQVKKGKKKQKPIKKDQLTDKSEPLQKRYIFRVDNLPQKNEFEEEEINFIDANIKKVEAKKTEFDELEDGEIKAKELFQEHIKEKDSETNSLNDLPSEETSQEIGTSQDLSSPSNSIKSNDFYFEDEVPVKELKPSLVSDKKIDSSIPLESDELEDLDTVGEVIKSDTVKLSDIGLSEKEWEELEFYTIHDPFAFIEVLRERDTLDKCYFLIEAALTEEEEHIFGFIMETIYNLEIDTLDLEKKGEDRYLLEKVDQVINDYNIKIDEEARKKIYYYISKTSLGFDKIDPLMKDPNIEDLSCDGAGVPLFVYHRKFGSLKSNIKFNDEEELSSFVYKLAQKCGKHISIAEPMLDATMPDGSRIQMTLSDEVTARGSTFTIRKFRADPFSPPDLVEFNTMSAEMIAYMWLAVENGINTLFAGGTASGKTTALNALSLFIPRESKIVSIEETREINLPHPNWIPGVSRSGFGEVVADKMVGEIDLYDLMKAALRQRPEYILVGEIRGKEAYVLFQAMATGHATYSTVHADSAQSLIHRLEGKPVNIPRVMLQSLDIVSLHVITRVKNMRARRCKQIIEIIDIDPTTKEILTNEVFRWEPVEDRFIFSGKSYVLERIRAEKDMSRERMTNEIKNRIKIIEWMSKADIREFRDVAKIVTQYTESPDETLEKIDSEVKNNA